ncbi:MAG: YgiT-type zinc finger protein [Anaerolineales bacterium]|nr:YgiT-type zinc finger protein [Anaerolineales bacterium]
MEEEVEKGMKEWRAAHPKATLREIEKELDERLSQLRAKLLTESAMTSEAANWEKEEAPVCPECGQKMEKRGEEKRRLKTGDGKEIELKRQYASCPACGAGFFSSG